MAKRPEKMLGFADSGSVESLPEDCSPRVGESQPIAKGLNNWNILAIGYNTSSTWIGLAVSMTVAIASGGSVTLLYGVIIVNIAMFFTGLTLAELASVYPTAGGQYHFTALLAPSNWGRSMSYICGVATAFAWMAQAANMCLFTAQILLAIVMHWQPEYEPRAWHYFLIYEAANVAMIIYNIFLTGRTMFLGNIGAILSLCCYVILTILCPIRAPEIATSSQVWASFVNSSGGWPDGVFFLIGLSTPQFSLMALDATLHLAEETLRPKKDIPKAVMATVIVGSLTGFSFIVSIAYSFPNMQNALQSPLPIMYILDVTLRSTIAATTFVAIFLFLALIVLNATHLTASRVTWSLARDNALIKSSKVGEFHPKLKVPVYALLLNGAFVGLAGIIYLLSSTAFNSLVGAATIVFQFTFALPAALLLLQRRPQKNLPHDRYFRLSTPVGYLANFITVGWAIVILIFFCFPSTFPVTSFNMNYACAVLGIMVVLGVINWFVYAQKHYKGPVIDTESWVL